MSDGKDGEARDGAGVTPEAARALAEAADRRSREAEARKAREVDGRAGPDPVRFGDWEVKGRAVDF